MNSQSWADSVRSTHLDIGAPESDASVGDATTDASDADAAAGGLRAPSDDHHVIKHSHHDRKLGRDVQLDVPKAGIGSSVAQRELVQLKQRLNNAEALGNHALRAIDRMAHQNKALRRFPVACPSCGTLNAPPGMAWGEGDVAECQGCHQSFVPLGNALHEDDLSLLRSAVQQMRVQHERANYWEAASKSVPGLRRDPLKGSQSNRPGSPHKAIVGKERRSSTGKEQSLSPHSPSRRGSLKASSPDVLQNAPAPSSPSKRSSLKASAEVPGTTYPSNQIVRHPQMPEAALLQHGGASKALGHCSSSASSSVSSRQANQEPEAEGRTPDKKLLSLMNTVDLDTQSSCGSPSWRGHGAWGKLMNPAGGQASNDQLEPLETWKQVFANAVGASAPRSSPRGYFKSSSIKEEGEITSEDDSCRTSEAASSRFSTLNFEHPSAMAQSFALPTTPRDSPPAGIVPAVCLDPTPPLTMPRHRGHQSAHQQHHNHRSKSKETKQRYVARGAMSPRPLASPCPAPPPPTTGSLHRSLKAIRLMLPGFLAVLLRLVLAAFVRLVSGGENVPYIVAPVSAVLLGGCTGHIVVIVRNSLDWGQKMETSKGDWRRAELHLGPVSCPGPGLSLEEALGAAYALAQLVLTFFFEFMQMYFRLGWGLIAGHVAVFIGLMGALHWYLVHHVFRGHGGSLVWAFAAIGNVVSLSVALFTWWPLTVERVIVEEFRNSSSSKFMDSERCMQPPDEVKVDSVLIAMTILHGANLWVAKKTHQPSLQCFCTLFAAGSMAGWCCMGPHVGAASTIIVFGLFCLCTGGFLWQQLIGSL